MDRLVKHLTIFLVLILAASSLLMVKPSEAQSIPKPSVPEFTLRYVNNSYFIPETTTYSTNPYTGEQKAMTSGGYLSKNTTIEIAVKSQSFTSSINGTSLQVYYNVRAKGYYEQNWSDLNIPADEENTITTYWLGYLPSQQNSDYTIISIPANTYPVGGTVEFQVRAILGGVFYVPAHDADPYIGYARSNFMYEASAWSNTQSVTMPNTSSSASAPSASVNPTPNVPASSPSSAVPEFPITVSLVAVLVIVSLVFIIGKRKRTVERMH